jgi:hypothetical protein
MIITPTFPGISLNIKLLDFRSTSRRNFARESGNLKRKERKIRSMSRKKVSIWITTLKFPKESPQLTNTGLRSNGISKS